MMRRAVMQVLSFESAAHVSKLVPPKAITATSVASLPELGVSVMLPKLQRPFSSLQPSSCVAR
jgi:hypothetical protein